MQCYEAVFDVRQLNNLTRPLFWEYTLVREKRPYQTLATLVMTQTLSPLLHPSNMEPCLLSI